jgi:hypothetical protein
VAADVDQADVAAMRNLPPAVPADQKVHMKKIALPVVILPKKKAKVPVIVIAANLRVKI